MGADERKPRVRRTRATKASLELPKVPNPWGLSEWSCEVLRQLCQGKLLKTVAADLGAGKSTVESHLQGARYRMKVNNTAQAMLLWDRHFRGTEP
jgi:DNA-binding NarL/FixJ family response regulator